MKKAFNYIAILGLVILLPLQAKAETSITTTKTPEKVVISSDKPTEETKSSFDQTNLKDQPLSVRKDKVGSDLNDLISQLGTFISRTQSALDRLSTKSIDTGKTQEELDLAKKSLLDAKVSLDIFSKIIIPDTKQEKASADLKASAKKTEDSLRESRLHLINALSILKDALNIQ